MQASRVNSGQPVAGSGNEVFFHAALPAYPEDFKLALSGQFLQHGERGIDPTPARSRGHE